MRRLCQCAVSSVGCAEDSTVACRDTLFVPKPSTSNTIDVALGALEPRSLPHNTTFTSSTTLYIEI